MVYAFYSVRSGKSKESRGVYTNWKACEKEIKNVKKETYGHKAVFKGFHERGEAEHFLKFESDDVALQWARHQATSAGKHPAGTTEHHISKQEKKGSASQS
jgi:viroplasmin and RNaseH domain-containing protein